MGVLLCNVFLLVFSAITCYTFNISGIFGGLQKNFIKSKALIYSSFGTNENGEDVFGGPEISLPLSFRSDNGTIDGDFFSTTQRGDSFNPYYEIVSQLSPSEHIQRFTAATPKRVQEAVKNTIMGLLGTLPRHAFETLSLGTSDALANLMFQLQMTGYMFKNAEYRLSLQNSLHESVETQQEQKLLKGFNETKNKVSTQFTNEEVLVVKKPSIHGKIKLSYETGQQIEVDAEAYMAELTKQVESLENKLAVLERKQKEAQTQDLLLYIRNMPTKEMLSLSANISQDVLDCMRMLVQAVLKNTATNKNAGQQMIAQQNSQGMAQLCMWQLAVGYSLREMEVRQELKKLLK